MRHFLFILMLTAFASLQGLAQKKAPEEKSIVNKEYDENGNLIQYDSTCVWQWNSDSTLSPLRKVFKLKNSPERTEFE